MATLARIDELCDSVAAALTAAAHGTATVTAADDVPDVDFETITERLVFVTPVGREDRGPVSRRQDGRAYQVGVVVVERYTAAGKMTRAWRSERTAWVDEVVVSTIGDARSRIEGAYAERIETTEDREEQVERKLFWSETVVTLVEEC